MDKPIYNAADPSKVKEAKHRERRQDEQDQDDLFNVLQSVGGRRVMWKLLEHCRTFGSIWHASALIHYNSGKQDVGHFILDLIQRADPKAFQLMMTESYKGER